MFVFGGGGGYEHAKYNEEDNYVNEGQIGSKYLQEFWNVWVVRKKMLLMTKFEYEISIM